MTVNNLILIINIICWAFVTIRYYIQRKQIDSAVFLLSTFLVYSICSYQTFNYEYGNFRGVELSILPLIYLFLMILLTMSPILRFNIAKIKKFPCNNYRVLDFLCWAFIVCMAIKLPFDIAHIREGFLQIMMDQGSELYTDVKNEGKSAEGAYVISSLPTIYVNISVEIITLIAFYNTYKKRRPKFTLITFLAIALTPLGSIASGQRGGAFNIIIVVIGTFFLFAPILDNKIKKVVKKIGIISLGCIMVPIVALTVSRFGSRGENAAEQSVYSYMGQQNIYFDLYAFDNNGLRYGDRVFPLFKKFLGFDNVPNNFWERRMKYPKLKINDEVFIGYIGDFLLDFGPIISTILFILFALIFLKITFIKKHRCYFHQLLALQFVLVLGLQGGLKLYPFADTASLKILAFGLLYIYLVFHKNKSYQTNSIKNISK